MSERTQHLIFQKRRESSIWVCLQASLHRNASCRSRHFPSHPCSEIDDPFSHRGYHWFVFSLDYTAMVLVLIKFGTRHFQVKLKHHLKGQSAERSEAVLHMVADFFRRSGNKPCPISITKTKHRKNVYITEYTWLQINALQIAVAARLLAPLGNGV